MTGCFPRGPPDVDCCLCGFVVGLRTGPGLDIAQVPEYSYDWVNDMVSGK